MVTYFTNKDIIGYFTNKNTGVFLLCIFLICVCIFAFYNINKRTINVGVLFTTSEGQMAFGEKNIFDIVIETIDLYNSIQSKIYLNAITYNPKSSTEEYVKGVKYLINNDVALIFGAWRSIDRQSILPIIEEHNNLLCYPLQYEGNECSTNILYFGACPNQQITVGIEYGIKNISSNIVLIGSDYIFPRTANKIINNYIQHLDAVNLDEIYVALDCRDFDDIVRKIISYYREGEKIMIVNTINGESNKFFFQALYNTFKQKYPHLILSQHFTIISFSVTENEYDSYNLEWIIGHYSVWNYSQTDVANNIYNTLSLEKCKLCKLITQYKHDNYIIDDPMYHGFLSVLLFTHFIDQYDGDFSSTHIRNEYMNNVSKQQVLTPTGYLGIAQNNHLPQPVFILQIDSNKRFKTIYNTPINIHPNPWFDNSKKYQYKCNNVLDFLGSKYTNIM